MPPGRVRVLLIVVTLQDSRTFPADHAVNSVCLAVTKDVGHVSAVHQSTSIAAGNPPEPADAKKRQSRRYRTKQTGICVTAENDNQPLGQPGGFSRELCK